MSVSLHNGVILHALPLRPNLFLPTETLYSTVFTLIVAASLTEYPAREDSNDSSTLNHRHQRIHMIGGSEILHLLSLKFPQAALSFLSLLPLSFFLSHPRTKSTCRHHLLLAFTYSFSLKHHLFLKPTYAIHHESAIFNL